MNFENESLSVDYITLNLKNGKDNIRKIAQYFNHYHQFNCYSCDQKIGFKSKKPSLDLVNPRYKLEMVVVFNSNSVNWNTVLIQFFGLNSCHFYLALRNEDLLKSNNQLKQELDGVLQELNAIKQEREEKAARKEARVNRKRLPKRDPMTGQIYKELIKEAEGRTYRNARLRLALCLLAVTGIRINELLNIKVSDLTTLIQENWIAIDRSKRGPSNHKAFLTKEGKKIIQDRKKDF